MNEELQSTNEELETMNDELRQRTDELNTSNAFLESILAQPRRGGRRRRPRAARARLERARRRSCGGLRAAEVLGEHFLGLDIGLPVAELARRCARCSRATSRRRWGGRGQPRGRDLRCTVPSDCCAARRPRRGLILLMRRRRLPDRVARSAGRRPREQERHRASAAERAARRRGAARRARAPAREREHARGRRRRARDAGLELRQDARAEQHAIASCSSSRRSPTSSPVRPDDRSRRTSPPSGCSGIERAFLVRKPLPRVRRARTSARALSRERCERCRGARRRATRLAFAGRAARSSPRRVRAVVRRPGGQPRSAG